MFRTLVLAAATVVALPSAAQDSTSALRAAQVAGLKANSPIVLQVSSARANRDGTTTMVFKLWATTKNLDAFVAIPARYAGWSCRGSDTATNATATFATPNRRPLSDYPVILQSADNAGFIISFNQPVVIPVISSCRPSSDRRLALDVAFRFFDIASDRWSTRTFTVGTFEVG